MKVEINNNSYYRTELCARSGYSMNKGVGSVKELVEAAYKNKIIALCLADDYSNAGYNELETYAKKYGIKPIFGVTIVVNNIRVVVIAKNKDGIKTINALISNSVDNTNKIEDIERNKDYIITIGIADNFDDCLEILKNYDYIGINPRMNIDYNGITKNIDDRVVFLSDSYYINKEDKLLYDALIGLYTKEYREVKNIDELLNEKNYDLVITNPNKIYSQIEEFTLCDYSVDYSYIIDKQEFCKLVKEKALKKYKSSNNIAFERINEELDGIISTDIYTYFYLAYRISKLIREQNSFYSIRGMAANSIISYVLDITDIDPIENKLDYAMFLGINFDKIPNFDFNIDEKISHLIINEIENIYGESDVFIEGNNIFLNRHDSLEMINDFINKNDDPYYYNLSNVRVFNLLNTIKNIISSNKIIIKPKDISISEIAPVKGKVILANYNLCNLLCVNIIPQMDSIFLSKCMDALGSRYNEIKITTNLLPLFENDELLNKRKSLVPGLSSLVGISEIGSTFAKKIIDAIKIESINDVSTLLSFLHGSNVFTDNIDKLFQKGYQKDELFSSRDDLMDLLVNKYLMNREKAFKISESIRKGRRLKDDDLNLLYDSNVPQYLIDSMKLVKYLFPKAHSLTFQNIYLKELYIKVHYPEIFYESYIETMNQINEFVKLDNLSDSELVNELNIHCNNDDKYNSILVAIEIRERGFKIIHKNNKIKIIESKMKSNIDLGDSLTAEERENIKKIKKLDNISTSRIQIELSIGYPKASNLYNKYKEYIKNKYGKIVINNKLTLDELASIGVSKDTLVLIKGIGPYKNDVNLSSDSNSSILCDAVIEMERRLNLLSCSELMNYREYNKKEYDLDEIVIVIENIKNANDVDKKNIARLVQLSSTTGIYLVVVFENENEIPSCIKENIRMF